MPYPPDQISTNELAEYRKMLAAYANDPSLRSKVLEAKSECEYFIGNLENSQEYLNRFFKYISSAQPAELKFDLRVYERAIADLPPSIHSDPDLNTPLVRWKRYLERTRDEITEALADRQPALSQAHAKAAQVASDITEYLEAVRLLEEQCERDCRNHPSQEPEIRRRYRKAIDALTDGV